MIQYQELVDLFEVMGIENESALTAALGGESETYDPFEAGWEPSEPKTLGGKVAQALWKIDLNASSGNQDWGIQQFSLCDKPQVPVEDIKKGLFLSRRSTIFTPHHFSIHSHHDDYYGDAPIYQHETTVTFDRDFIRELFTYRESIKRGELRLLPAEMASSSSQYTDSRGHQEQSSETKSLLSEINRSNVLKIDPGPDILQQVLKRFSRREQVVHLPSLRVPWIKDLEIDDILRIKTDEKPAIDRFQAAYHEALAEHIKNYESVDYGRISEQIQEDIIQPKLDDIERSYKRVVGLHRKLAAAGAALAFLPLAMTILSAEFFQTTFSQPLSFIPAVVSGSVGSFALNKIQVENKKGELEETEFYILWRLLKDK